MSDTPTTRPQDSGAVPSQAAGGPRAAATRQERPHVLTLLTPRSPPSRHRSRGCAGQSARLHRTWACQRAAGAPPGRSSLQQQPATHNSQTCQLTGAAQQQPTVLNSVIHSSEGTAMQAALDGSGRCQLDPSTAAGRFPFPAVTLLRVGYPCCDPVEGRLPSMTRQAVLVLLPVLSCPSSAACLTCLVLLVGIVLQADSTTGTKQHAMRLSASTQHKLLVSMVSTTTGGAGPSAVNCHHILPCLHAWPVKTPPERPLLAVAVAAAVWAAEVAAADSPLPCVVACRHGWLGKSLPHPPLLQALWHLPTCQCLPLGPPGCLALRQRLLQTPCMGGRSACIQFGQHTAASEQM